MPEPDSPVPGPSTEIVLAYSPSRHTLVALAHGPDYARAHEVLQQAGARPDADAMYQIPMQDPAAFQRMLETVLPQSADTAITTRISARPYLGDVAERIAEHLDGPWTADVHVYALPDGQRNVRPWLWDDGPLAQALDAQAVPYAATLTHGDGTALLLAEDPAALAGDASLLIGAFAPPGVPGGDFADALDAPTSIIVPGPYKGAALAIQQDLLPRYRHADRIRRASEVGDALDLAHEALAAWERTVRDRASGDHRELSLLRQRTKERLWQQFTQFLDYGGPLLAHAEALPHSLRAQLAAGRDPEHALDLLKAAFAEGQERREEWNATVQRLRETPRRLPPVSVEVLKNRRNHGASNAIARWMQRGQLLLDLTQTEAAPASTKAAQRRCGPAPAAPTANTQRTPPSP
ncbi:hypothetical protein AB0J38_24945 [Streptomyces sp. NPDC050095]|uniref:hypothetical protein n=1 Tax=unclassified Streptomyces TaxID=2593676 RepID=UPI00343A448F